MSEARVNLVADASQLYQELEKAANELNKIRGAGDVTGQNLAQSYDLASKSVLALNNYLKQNANRLRNAKAEVSGTVQKIQAYSRSNKVAGLNVRELAASLDRLEKEYETNRKQMTLSQKMALLQLRTWNRQRVEVSKLTLQQREYRNALNATTVAQKNLRVSTGQLNSSTSQMGGGFKSLLKIGKSVAGVFGAALGVYELIMAVRGAAKIIMDFDQEMRTLASISGATSIELDNLSRTAISVGMATRFSAMEVAGLMTELSRLGFAVEEIDAMTEGISKLATAANEELEPTAETVGNIIRAMGYDADDTAHIVDVMALSFNRSALDLSRFRESMKYVSPLARGAGFSIENVSAVLAKLADAGVRGSMAGTSLRNVFMALSDESSELSQALGGGVTNFDDFINRMEELKESGIDSGEVFKLIDRTAVTALNTILDNTSSIRQLSDDMENANGAVDEMANIQMQSLKNKAEIAKNAWQGLVLAIDKGDGLLSNMIRGTLTGFARTIENITSNMNLQSDQMREQLAVIEELERVTADSNTTMEERIKIMQRLNDEYPEMFNGMEIEESNWKNIQLAIDDAIEKKRTYINLQLKDEELSDQQTRIQRLAEDWGNMSAEVRLFYESLDKTGETFKELSFNAKNASIIQGDFLGGTSRLEETIGKTNVTLGEFYDALENRKAYEQAIKYTERLLEIKRAIAVEGIPAAEGLMGDDFTEIVSNSVEKYIDEMNKMAAAAMQSGDTRVQAYDKSVDGIKDTINEEIEEFEKRREALKNSMSLPMVAMYEEQGMTEEAINYQIELRRIALEKVLDSMEDILKSSSDEIGERSNLLKLEQKIEETKARIATGDISLQQRLADIRLKYGRLIAKETLKDEELKKTLQLLELEYQEDLKNIELDRIKEVSKQQEDAFNRRIEQLKSEMELVETDSGGTSANPRIAAIEREMEILKESNQLSEQLREQEYSKERNSLIRQIDEKKELYKKDGLSRKNEIDQINEEILALERRYNEKGIIEQREYNLELQKLDQKLFEQKKELYKENYDFQKRQLELQQQIAIQEAETPRNLIEALDLLGIRTREQRELEKAIALRRAKEQVEEIEREKEILRIRLEKLKADQIGATGEQSNIIAQQIEQIENALKGLDLDEFEANNLLNKLLNPSLNQEEWNEIISQITSFAGDIVSVYQNILENQLRIAQEERQLRDRNISELQRDIDIQLRLKEQGYANDVKAYMKALEEQKRLRDRALEQEKQAANQARIVEGIIQGANLATSVSEILKVESEKGLLGIAAAGVGLGVLFGLWQNAQQRAIRETQPISYEKGGSFMLNGASHAQGGIALAPGREAQGGEMVSVFSRPATRKYGSQIKEMTDQFNKGKIGQSSGEYIFDTTDIKAIRKLLENREDVQIQGNYKVIKSGNKTTLCRLN